MILIETPLILAEKVKVGKNLIDILTNIFIHEKNDIFAIAYSTKYDIQYVITNSEINEMEEPSDFSNLSLESIILYAFSKTRNVLNNEELREILTHYRRFISDNNEYFEVHYMLDGSLGYFQESESL